MPERTEERNHKLRTIDDLERIDLTDVRPFARGEQYAQFRLLRDHEPLHWNDEAEGAGFWSVTRYADVLEAANDHERLSSAYGTQIREKTVEGPLTSLHNMDPPRHSKLRKIAIPHLRAVKVRQWEAAIDETITRLLDAAVDAGEVDLVAALGAPMPVEVLGRIIGVPAEESAPVVEWIQLMIDPESTAPETEVDAARESFADYFRRLTELRRADPRGDIVSILAQATIDGEPLSWGDTQAYLSLFVAAGIETTRNLITGSFLALHQTPGAWDRLRSDESVLPSAVEEMLRYVSPLACMRRTAVAQFQLHDRTVEPGQKVVLWFNSANRDDRVFAEPDSFVIDRFVPDSAPGQVAFGWGIHACMGAHLARQEMYSLLRQVVARRLEVVPTGEPVRIESNMFQGFKSLPVRLAPMSR